MCLCQIRKLRHTFTWLVNNKAGKGMQMVWLQESEVKERGGWEEWVARSKAKVKSSNFPGKSTFI